MLSNVNGFCVSAKSMDRGFVNNHNAVLLAILLGINVKDCHSLYDWACYGVLFVGLTNNHY